MKFVKCFRRDGGHVFINFNKVMTIRQRKDEKGGCHTVLRGDDGVEVLLAESETPEVVLRRANIMIDKH
jgi:hypothetical protein